MPWIQHWRLQPKWFELNLFTQVSEYGQLNGHLGVHEEGVVKIGFTLHRLLANICL